MRILVTGGLGMSGLDLQDVLTSAAHEVTAAGRADLDVTSAKACRDAVSGHGIVVNAAARTKVDDAEAQEAAAFSVNATGAANVARACTAHGSSLVHVSTDYVFAGEASTPYAEDAPLSPRSAYGRTKAAGEWAVRAECPQTWVVRTAWLYGKHGPNFVKTMARLADQHDTVAVVDDQRGQPTWTYDLGKIIGDLVTSGAPFGTYHGTSSGETTWYGFTQEIFRQLGLDPDRVRATTADAFPRPAPRPAYSVLGHDAWTAAGLDPLPDWRSGIQRSIAAVVGHQV